MKSASLVRCAAELGASLGSDDTGEVCLYAEFGWHYGLMVQLMNDIAAVWPGAKDKSDLRLRKKTPPIAFALNLAHGSSHYSGIVRSFYEQSGCDLPTEADVKWALWRCGAIHFAWAVAAREKAKLEQIAETLFRGKSQDWPLARLLA